jgi:P4 family phage/plasmid primase-like protien
VLIRYTTFNGVLDKMPVSKIEAWDFFTKKLERHTVQPAKPDGKQAKGALWSPTVYAPGETRGAAHVELVTCFVADVDDGTDWNELLPRWSGLVWALHSSFSSTPEHPKWRAVFPLRKAVPGEAWGAVWAKLNRELMAGHCDAATKDPSRIYFWPSCKEGAEGEAFVYANGGEEDVFLDHMVYADPEVPAKVGTSAKPNPRPRLSTTSTGTEVSGAKLLEKYIGLARPGGRNRTAFDLACQLRDNAFSAGEALALLEDFKASMGADFDDDMNHVWEQANNRSPRQPWTKPGDGSNHREPRTATLPARSFQRADGSAATAEPLSYVDITTGQAEAGNSHITDKWTDVGNKDRFLRHFADQVRYDPSRGWMVWDGKRWGQDVDGGQVMNFAVMVARSLYSEEEPMDEKQCQLWRQFVKSTNQVGKIRAFVDLAKCDPAIRVYADVWDADPWVLNCANGVLDLKTGELREHDPLAYCTYITRAAYQKGAQSELWAKCLSQWQPIEAKRAYLQRHAGYDLTGSTREQTAVFHFGDGSNGKTIYTGTQEWIMGDYAARVPMAVLVDDKPRGGQASPDVARLAGRRLVIASEITSAKGLNESIIKDLTGGDTLTARFLNANPFEFRPSFKLVFFGNHKPQIRNQDDGIWRRLPLVEWATKIEEADKDKDLLQKLQSEENMSGILSWMVEGCLAWQESGLAAPEEVRESSNSYRAEQDQIGKFLGECCVLGEGFFCPTKTLRAAYERWCEDNGEKWQASPNQFAERLRRAGATPAATPRRVNGALVRGWDGVGVTAERDDESGVTPTNEGNGQLLIPNERPIKSYQSQNVTPVTPERITPHTRAHTHIKPIHSDVTGVTEVTEVKRERGEATSPAGELRSVTGTSPGDTPPRTSPSTLPSFSHNPPPKADHDPADTTATRVYEKALIEWTRRDASSGKLAASSASQAAVWANLESELEELRVLHETPGRAEDAKAAEPELRARMVTLASWWRRNCPVGTRRSEPSEKGN